MLKQGGAPLVVDPCLGPLSLLSAAFALTRNPLWEEYVRRIPSPKFRRMRGEGGPIRSRERVVA